MTLHHAYLSVKQSAVRLKPNRRLAWFAGALSLGLSLVSLPAWAGDPFRTTNPHAIGDATEAAFNAMFREGDYVETQRLVQIAVTEDPNEPMVHAMAAATAYLNNDWDGLAGHAEMTQTTADALMATDPLRGNIYSAVGIFLEGAHVLQTQGIARGTPTALRMLQQVFDRLDEAEKIAPDDPELSLLQGFMNLLLAVNLPFANPDQAIARLEQGYPPYLSHRGIALGLRDLGRYDEALTQVNKAIEAAPENPDLLYLKAQILRLKGDNAQSVNLYTQTLNYESQLPVPTVRQIKFEQCLAQGVEGPVCVERSGVGQN